jgi:hypothetical protein
MLPQLLIVLAASLRDVARSRVFRELSAEERHAHMLAVSDASQ